jgi:hypothetical protein
MLHPTCGGFVEGRIGMARLCNAYPYRRRFGANRGDDHCPNSSDLGADGTNRRELISCETPLAGWQWHSRVHSFCNCMQSQLQPQASCFVFNTRSPVLPLPCPAECLHLFVSFILFSQPSCSPSLDSKNIGGAKPLGAAGGLVVGLQGVLRLSPTSEE